MSLLYVLLVAAILWVVLKSIRGGSTKQGLTQHPSVEETTAETVAPDSDRDNWEGSFWEVQDPFPVKAALRIDYEDATGRRTQRTVDVRQCGPYLDCSLLIAHCRLRNATRTFRTDRILRCIDEETGEIVSDVQSYLRNRYEASPEFARDKLFDEEYDTLRILLYVGKADGQLRAAERAIIRDTCRVLAADSRITDDLIDEMFAALDVPTIHAFKLAVGRLSKAPSAGRMALVKAAEDIVATQKTVHPAEQEALEYMRKRLLESRSGNLEPAL